MNKCIYIFLLSFYFVTNLFSSTKESEPLIIGTTSGYAPFVSLNEKGEYEGFDIDVGKELARRLERSFVLQDCGNMPGLMLALKQKRVDVIIWAISITEGRLKNMEVVYYQGEKKDKTPIIFWNTIPKNIESFSDLGKDPKNVVCVEAGSYQEDILKGYPAITLKYLDKVTDVILDLKYGKSTASVVDASLIAGLTAKYPELKVKYLPLPSKDFSFGNGICINKSNQELAAKVRQAVDDFLREGKIAELEKKWGLNNDQ